MKVQILLSSVLLAGSALCQSVPSVPGLASWQSALAAHARAEGILTGSTPPPPFAGGKIPGLPQWQAHQASVLAAERRLEEQRSLLEGQATATSLPESVKTSSAATQSSSVDSSISTISSFLSSIVPSATTSSSSSASSSSSTVALPGSTTEASSPIKAGFDNILKSSIAKFIEQIETAKKEEIPERSSVSKILKSHKFDDSNGRTNTFLDKLLNSFDEEDNSVLDYEAEEPRKAVKVPKDFRDLGFEDKLESQLNDFIAILEQIEGSEDYNSLDDTVEVDRSFKSGRVLGNFIQQELQEAADESVQLSRELDQLLVELEEEKQKDLRFLEGTYKIINNRLKGKTLKQLKKDKKFVNSVFHRFALLGHPLREEDISLKMLKDAKEIVTANVLAAAEQSRNIALDIRAQLTGNIRRSGRSGPSLSDLGDVERTLKAVLKLI